ncbi:MFS transporter [Candidatus Gracilibacteria bacterium]|nr:MFS transporter [Candidatus Gracilibacteria bacterium]
MAKQLILKLRPASSPLVILFEVNFLRHLSSATISAVTALFFRQFVDSDAAVGAIFFVGYLVATFANYMNGYVIEILKRRKSLVLALALFTVSFAFFSITSHYVVLLFLFGCYQFGLSLFITDISLYIKHYSNFGTIATNSGKLGTFGNIGWLIGPFFGSLVAAKFGFAAVFMISSMFSSLALLIFFFHRLDDEHVVVHHESSVAKTLMSFFKVPNLRRTYLNKIGLGFMYSLWDLLPLLMTSIGASVPVIGMTRSMMGLPQSLFEYPLGTMADKETGERRLAIIGYIVMGLFTAMLGLTGDLRLFITFFFIASVGTTFVEMTSDSYLYRQIKEKDVGTVAIYRTADTLPYLVGQGLGMIMLCFISIQAWFVIGGIITTLFAFNAYRMREFKSKITWEQ